MTQHDQPDCFELIRTVNDFLESIEGKLHGSDKYGLQCAKHVLNIIAREIEGAPDGSLQTAMILRNFVWVFVKENMMIIGQKRLGIFWIM